MANPGSLDILPAASFALPFTIWIVFAILSGKPIAKHSFSRAFGDTPETEYPEMTLLNAGSPAHQLYARKTQSMLPRRSCASCRPVAGSRDKHLPGPPS